MQPPSNLKSVDLSLVVLTWRPRIQALSIADTVFHMQSQSMLHIYSALQGIESTALPTGEYLDIDSPCSLSIAVVMKNSKPNPSPLPHLLS